MAASGAQEQLESNPGYYQSLLAAEHHAKLRDTIRAGEIPEAGPLLPFSCCSSSSWVRFVVNNTRKNVEEFFMYHPDMKQLVDSVKILIFFFFFWGGSDLHRTFPDNILFKSEASLQSSLFNVLVAYGHHNQAVGYCQVRSMTSLTFDPVCETPS